MSGSERKRGMAPWKIDAGIYLAVWTACVLWFWLGMGGGGWIMAYTILTFGTILPVATLVTSFRLERKQDLGLWRWAVIGGFGMMYMGALWATFTLSTVLGIANIAPPSPLYTIAGLIPSAAGIALGWLVRRGKLSAKVPAAGLFLLLCACYVGLKTMNGSLFRPVLILDLPVLALLATFGVWALHRRGK